MRRRGMVLEPAVRGAARVAMFGGLIGTQVQLQGGMDWAKTEVNGGRVLDNGPGPEDDGDPCNQLPRQPAISVAQISNSQIIQLPRLQFLDFPQLALPIRVYPVNSVCVNPIWQRTYEAKQRHTLKYADLHSAYTFGRSGPKRTDFERFRISPLGCGWVSVTAAGPLGTRPPWR